VIRGYVEHPSPRPGDRWTLRVSTDAPLWRVQFYRCGAELVACGGAGWFPSVDAPPHLPGQDWGRPGTGLAGEHLEPWPAYPLRVPEDWASGVYLLVLVEGDGRGGEVSRRVVTTADARSGTALLVVRPPAGRESPLLYKVPLLTYQAYNLGVAEGPASWCLYDTPERLPPGVRPGVSLHRPGAGTGGTPWDIGNPDPYDATPRQTFVHWDARFVAWLERTGHPVDYCTDVDLHRTGGELLAPHRLLVSAGHDEYWSEAMRTAVEEHVAGGGNVAFFGGNTCWWRVEFDDDVVYRRTKPWWEDGRPENTLTGVSFRNGGERDRDEHPVPVGYRVQHAGHWAYAGTGLRDGDRLGAAEHLVGYECDGAVFDRSGPQPAVPTGADGTPREFVVLGVGDCRPSGWGLGNGAATMGLYTRGGTVFTAATTDWPRVLTAGTAPAVERVTRNVLDRLGRF
jgi:hypothetical protein